MGLFPPAFPADAPHGTTTTAALPRILKAEFGLKHSVALRLARVIGGHHGVFPLAADIVNLPDEAVGTGVWDEARAALVRLLARSFELAGIEVPHSIDNAPAMIVAGFVSVADWIGSAENFFPLAVTDPTTPPIIDPGGYTRQAQKCARTALSRLGWIGWVPAPGTRVFKALFPEIPAPNPLQEKMIELAGLVDLSRPNFVIVEAPTGEGKTEAAMYLADVWGSGGGQRGTYFALPTQATSNQMFGRVRDFLKNRYPADVVNLQLLHGHAALSAEFELLRRHADALLNPTESDHEGSGDAGSGVIAAEWFTYRKRGLLAPFGVGTVDQALLAVLQTRHVFVRLFGLSGKTVIIDEVHAYDTYMTALLERLLEWLASLGCPVVLLSATLARARREALLAAYRRGSGGAGESQALEPTPYPRITWVTAEARGAVHVGTSNRSARAIELAWVDGRLPESGNGEFELGRRLRAALANGGCAAVICNTVGRAQEVYRALKPYFPDAADDGQPELDLLHARFLFEERERREQQALVRFGKPGGEVTIADGKTRNVRRPSRAVLVATQIIEQSLDLDFDLMVTDLAPADLVLQRAGRLHRHPRQRPGGLERAWLWISQPDTDDGVPQFDPGTAAVYDGHTLLRSWLALRDRAVIRVPDDVEDLIEAVYDDRACPEDLSEGVRARWATTSEDLHAQQDHETLVAETALIVAPTFGGDILTGFNKQLDEDDPTVHQALQAATRLSEPAITVIYLSEPEAAAQRASQTPTTDEAARLLKRSVRVSGRGIVQALGALDPPPGWMRSRLLRHCRLLAMDTEGCCQVGTYRIRLDQETGLIVQHDGKE